MRRAFLLGMCCAWLATTTRDNVTRAGVAYPDPAGGWTYTFDGTAVGTPAAALDGTWSAVNGSSAWGGDGLDPTDGNAGGLASVDGAIRLVDAKTAGSGTTDNRKIYLTRPITGDNI